MSRTKCLIILGSLLSAVSILPVEAAVEVFPRGSEWRFRLGTNEASALVDAWRAIAFDDLTWTAGPTPIGYGETDIATTLPTDVAGNYTSVYARKHFTIADPSKVAQLNLQLWVDDGLVVWLNGVEVGRNNMAAGNLAYNARSVAALEPHLVEVAVSTGVGTILVPGDNVVAVHYFNAPSASSDIYLDVAMSYIEPDPIPPVISNVSPQPGTVNQLTQITVTFSEPVANVEAFDLLVNGQFATTVNGSGATYTFLFPQPAYGSVQIGWSPDHGITDLGIPPNPFDHTAPTASWQYTLVDIFAPFVASVIPPAGSTVRSLNQIQVRFNEGVAGVDAADLVINGTGASGMTAISASEYAFTFPEPSVGTVSVAWATPSGIQDLAVVPNSFGGGNWAYELDPTASSATLVISEFMASNGTPGPGEQSVMDEDGEYSDWIEIYNPGDIPVNLLGWALTDDPDDLNRWRFPDTNVLAGQFMLVFASGKNRREAGAPLHTDFQLRIDGEYLALVNPDGVVVSEFSPYPQQLRNVSYGYGFDAASFTLIPSNAPVRYLVPDSGALGTNWVFPAFNDVTWTGGTTAVGYDTGAQDPAEDSIPYAVLGLNPDAYWRFSEASGATAANLGTLGAAANGTYTGTVTLGQAGPRPPAFSGFESDNTAPRFSGDDSVSTSSSVVNNRSAFTMAGWINPAAAQAARTGLFGQNDAIEFGFIDSATIQIWTPNGGSINVAYPYPSGQWHHVTVVGDGTSLRVYFDGALAGSGGTPTASYGTSGSTFRIGGGGIFDTTGNFFNGHIDEVAVYTRALNPTEILAHVQASGGSGFSYTNLIKTDVRSAMLGVNSSIYLRLHFQVTDPSLIDRLSLMLQYDDGFVAYLNGTPVAADNAPLLPNWDSAATARNADARAVQYAEVNLSTVVDLLQPGDNVLALHGLNFSSTNVDFLISATLAATTIGSISPSERYFTTPSPGDVNGVGTQDLGPIIRDVVHTPPIPNDTDDLLVTARFLPVFSRPLTGATLHYRFMFGGTTSVPMTDGGLDGDLVAGDGVFSALIPAAANTSPGQMIRWYVTATDFAGNQSRWPLYEDKTVGGSEEYLGIVVNDPALTSKLPIFQLFVEANQLGPIDTESGGRIAVYYDGELYDNVYAELRGNTTAGYLKKSHRIQFPREHLFRHPGADVRVRNTSFQADYPDPSYMRQGLAYWLGNLIGCPSPFYYPVRLQTNGVSTSWPTTTTSPAASCLPIWVTMSKALSTRLQAPSSQANSARAGSGNGRGSMRIIPTTKRWRLVLRRVYPSLSGGSTSMICSICPKW